MARNGKKKTAARPQGVRKDARPEMARPRRSKAQGSAQPKRKAVAQGGGPAAFRAAEASFDRKRAAKRLVARTRAIRQAAVRPIEESEHVLLFARSKPPVLNQAVVPNDGRIPIPMMPHTPTMGMTRNVSAPIEGSRSPVETSATAAMGLAFPEKYPAKLHQDINYPTKVYQLESHHFVSSVNPAAGVYRVALSFRPSLKEFYDEAVTFVASAPYAAATFTTGDHPALAEFTSMAVRYRCTGMAFTSYYVPSVEENGYQTNGLITGLWSTSSYLDPASMLNVQDSSLAPLSGEAPMRTLWKLHLPEDEDWIAPATSFDVNRHSCVYQAQSSSQFMVYCRVTLNIEVIPGISSLDLVRPTMSLKDTPVYDDVANLVTASGAETYGISSVLSRAVDTLSYVETLVGQVTRGASLMDRFTDWAISAMPWEALVGSVEYGIPLAKGGKAFDILRGSFRAIAALTPAEVKQVQEACAEAKVPKLAALVTTIWKYQPDVDTFAAVPTFRWGEHKYTAPVDEAPVMIMQRVRDLPEADASG